MVYLPMKRSREDKLDSTITSTANYLILLSSMPTSTKPYDATRIFECKTCNREFTSFQALGGHRASHKKPRLVDGNTEGHHDQGLSSKPKSHKCSICGLEFSVGQALGGHMRRHRAVVTTDDRPTPVIDVSSPVVKKVNSRRVFSLDLNLTPLENGFEFRVDDEKVTPITVDFFL
ncbi:hypothetical protein R6Q59_014461 [Mikania micrantha]|uniref:C2H2-type domain-containing protein n=1 Tax=Mikania micrantha TaxID=192012 RepID=A0A5N6P8I2_9ASTR|nr:hypothetical protein E3N88_13480 [Mikania micrantha]